MASMSLGVGLTHVRKYDFVRPGYFYSSIYSISLGLERVLKLILIYEHRISNNDESPTNQQLRAFGHKLTDLFDHALTANKGLSLAVDETFYFEEEICQKILGFLSDFAIEARYYNLDSLTGKPQRNQEPLHRWDSEINSLIVKKHYKPQRHKSEQIKEIASSVADITYVNLTDYSGQNINSLREFYTKGDQVTSKQKYSMYYLYLIIRFLCRILASLESQGGFYPFLREYFYVFMNEDTSMILSKKSWNPNPPYKF